MLPIRLPPDSFHVKSLSFRLAIAILSISLFLIAILSLFLGTVILKSFRSAMALLSDPILPDSFMWSCGLLGHFLIVRPVTVVVSGCSVEVVETSNCSFSLPSRPSSILLFHELFLSHFIAFPGIIVSHNCALQFCISFFIANHTRDFYRVRFISFSLSVVWLLPSILMYYLYRIMLASFLSVSPVRFHETAASMS
jgi:hypothetical protein